jgi:hypothetical protein
MALVSGFLLSVVLLLHRVPHDLDSHVPATMQRDAVEAFEDVLAGTESRHGEATD